jgi:glycosyltransferase involved in cell wall biosynthesis
VLRVSQVSSNCYPNIGGVATHVHELSSSLAAGGARVEILSFRRGSLLQSLGGGESVYSVGDVPVRLLALGSLPGGRLRYWRLRRDAARLSPASADGAPRHVVHSHDMDYSGYLATRLSADIRVFTNHTSGFLQDLDERQKRELWRDQMAAFDHVIAPSGELRDRTVELGIDAARVSYVPNGVDPAKFRPDPEARARVRSRLGIQPDQVVVFSTRRFVPKNGVIDLAHGLRYLAPVREQVTMVFAGNGFGEPDPLGYEKEALAAIRASPLADKVRLLGPVANDSIAELYAAADLSVLPSLKEATSISGLEAMSSGLSLVGTRIGGIPDLIDHERTGLLVDPGDPRGLADAIMSLVQRPDFRRQLGDRARARVVNEFSWQQIARRTQDVYERTLEAQDRRRRDDK